MTDYASKLLKGAGIIFLAGILSSALGYLIRVVLAKKLTTEEFGLFFAVYNFVLIVGWIKGFGIGSAIGKYIPEFRVKENKEGIKSVLVFVLAFTLLSSLFLFLLFYLLPGGLINNYFQSGLGKTLLLVLLVFIFIDGLSQIITSYFLSVHKFFLYSLRELVIRSMIILLAMAFVEGGVLKIAAVYILASLAGLGVNWFFFLRHFSFFNHQIKITKELVKGIFGFGLPLMIRDLFGTFIAKMDSLVLVYFRPLTEVAIYNVILPTADLLLLFGRPFGRIMFPLSSELWALNNREQVSSLLRRIQKYLFLVVVPFVVALFVFAEPLLEMFFGADYRPGSFGLKLLAIGIMVGGFNITSDSVLLGIGKPKVVTKIAIFVSFLNLLLNIILIPLFGKSNQGYLGAVTATVFCFLLAFLFFSYYLYKFLGYLPPVKGWFLTGVIGFSLLILSKIVIDQVANLYTQILVFILLISILYPSLLILFGLTSKREIKGLISLLFKKTNI